MLIHSNVLSNIKKIELSKLVLIKLVKLKDVRIVNCIFAYSTLPELGNSNSINQTLKSHLYNLNFEDTKFCIMCIASKSTKIIK